MSEESMPIKPHPDFLKAMEKYGKMTDAEKLVSWEQAVQEDLETMRRHLPEGYVIVPVEPTHEMEASGIITFMKVHSKPTPFILDQVYKAMIKAAQKEDE